MRVVKALLQMMLIAGVAILIGATLLGIQYASHSAPDWMLVTGQGETKVLGPGPVFAGAAILGAEVLIACLVWDLIDNVTGKK